MRKQHRRYASVIVDDLTFVNPTFGYRTFSRLDTVSFFPSTSISTFLLTKRLPHFLACAFFFADIGLVPLRVFNNDSHTYLRMDLALPKSNKTAPPTRDLPSFPGRTYVLRASTICCVFEGIKNITARTKEKDRVFPVLRL